jgi:stringent starvation protein B
MSLPSTKPYLIRAIYEWCGDNGFTPYVAVIVDARTRVPMEFVRDGQIVLNVSAEATNRLMIGNDFIEFQARFGGVARDLSVPMDRIAAIYARENGAGMAFDVDDESDSDGSDSIVLPDAPPDQEPPEPPATPPAGRPKLQRIK